MAILPAGSLFQVLVSSLRSSPDAIFGRRTRLGVASTSLRSIFFLHLQDVPELHIGLRTGYCGSLTTFASWKYSLVTGLIGGKT